MNLVDELQVSAEQDDVLTLLRKTKRLASKLDRQDISGWLVAELEGYSEHMAVKVPDYRRVGMTLAYRTNGYIPAGFGMMVNGIQDLPNCGLDLKSEISEPISTVLTWIEGLHGEASIFQSVTPEMDQVIRETFVASGRYTRQLTFLSRANSSQIRAIPERIKDVVLEWALGLERAGVTGEGMSFSTDDKRIASSVVFNIHNSQIEQLTNTGSNRKGNE